ncbi:MAG TPA: hypothetical protein VFS21_33480 [Roseiflexaceae bacterium]|nr:hypothetical protein [Roseiflexaceae bacterium]
MTTPLRFALLSPRPEVFRAQLPAGCAIVVQRELPDSARRLRDLRPFLALVRREELPLLLDTTGVAAPCLADVLARIGRHVCVVPALPAPAVVGVIEAADLVAQRMLTLSPYVQALLSPAELHDSATLAQLSLAALRPPRDRTTSPQCWQLAPPTPPPLHPGFLSVFAALDGAAHFDDVLAHVDYSRPVVFRILAQARELMELPHGRGKRYVLADLVVDLTRALGRPSDSDNSTANRRSPTPMVLAAAAMQRKNEGQL